MSLGRVSETNLSRLDEHGVHLPGGDDELLSLGTGVGVEEVSHDEEPDLAGDVAVLLMLASGGTETQDEEDVPGHADLEEHLEVEDAKHAGVKLGAHEEVVDGITRHAVLLTAPDGGEVGDKADEEAAQNGDRQERTELVNGRVERPGTREVQNGKDGEGRVETPVGIAVVAQLLAPGMSKRFAVAPDTREDAVESTLDDEVGPVPGPDLGARIGTRVDEVDKVGTKVGPGLTGLTRGELAIIVSCANPHVPHEDREAGHHGEGAERTSKLKLARVVDLGVLTWPPAVDDMRILRNTLSLVKDACGRGRGRNAIEGGDAVGLAVAIGVAVAIDGAHVARFLLVVLVEVLNKLGGPSTDGGSAGSVFSV